MIKHCYRIDLKMTKIIKLLMMVKKTSMIHSLRENMTFTSMYKQRENQYMFTVIVTLTELMLILTVALRYLVLDLTYFIA